MSRGRTAELEDGESTLERLRKYLSQEMCRHQTTMEDAAVDSAASTDQPRVAAQ